MADAAAPAVRARAVARDLGAIGVGLGIGLGLGALAAADGGYFPPSWGWTALVGLWIAAAWLLLDRVEVAGGRLGVAFFAALIALGGWTWLSLLWTENTVHTALVGFRVIAYLGAAAAMLFVVRRETSSSRSFPSARQPGFRGTRSAASKPSPPISSSIDPRSARRCSGGATDLQVDRRRGGASVTDTGRALLHRRAPDRLRRPDLRGDRLRDERLFGGAHRLARRRLHRHRRNEPAANPARARLARLRARLPNRSIRRLIG